ncbi:hypothetical protein B0H14DRAFT_2592453 [Mycena olivaceomarginata]|nr:hypothetical protein B0H14DRAFT_2592453 [Mycena olivaceomarginata]
MHYTTLLRDAIKKEAETDVILDLVEKGADVNTKVDDCTHVTALQLAASRGDTKFVVALLAHDARQTVTGYRQPRFGKRALSKLIADNLAANGLQILYTML